jgi:hypothetical protein
MAITHDLVHRPGRIFSIIRPGHLQRDRLCGVIEPRLFWQFGNVAEPNTVQI